MREKLKQAKDAAVRHSPKVVALAGAAVGGAYMMSRYNDHMNHLVSVHRAIGADLRTTGKAIVFETPQHGTFVLAPVVKQ